MHEADSMRMIRELQRQHRRDQDEIAQLRLRLRDAEESATYRSAVLRKRPGVEPKDRPKRQRPIPHPRADECDSLLRMLEQILREGARDFGCFISGGLPHMQLRALYDCMAQIIRESVDAMREDMRSLYQWGDTNLRQNLFSTIFEARLNERLQDPDAYIAEHTGSAATRVARLLTLHRTVSPDDLPTATALTTGYPNCFSHTEVRRRTMAVLTLANDFITHLHNQIRLYQTQQTFSGAILRSRPLSLYQQWEETIAPVTVGDNATLNAAMSRAPISGSAPTRTKMLTVADVPHIRRVVTSETVVASEGANWRPCEDARIVMVLEDVLRAMPPRRLLPNGRLEMPREFITRIATRLTPHTVDAMPDIGSVVIRDEDEDAGTATVLPLVQPRSGRTVERGRVVAEPVAPAASPAAPPAPPDVDYSRWISTSSMPDAPSPSDLLDDAVSGTESFARATLVKASGQTRRVWFLRVPEDIAHQMRTQNDVGPYRVGNLTFAPMRPGDTLRLEDRSG